MEIEIELKSSFALCSALVQIFSTGPCKANRSEKEIRATTQGPRIWRIEW